VILLWSSGIWRRSEKVLGTLIVPGGPGLALLLSAAAFALPWQSCSVTTGSTVSGQVITTPEVCTGFVLPGVVGYAVLLFGLVAPLVVAVVLLNRARRRIALEYP
jgi:hypothetical protein